MIFFSLHLFSPGSVDISFFFSGGTGVELTASLPAKQALTPPPPPTALFALLFWGRFSSV
jgi:hypothetical protein